MPRSCDFLGVSGWVFDLRQTRHAATSGDSGSVYFPTNELNLDRFHNRDLTIPSHLALLDLWIWKTGGFGTQVLHQTCILLFEPLQINHIRVKINSVILTPDLTQSGTMIQGTATRKWSLAYGTLRPTENLRSLMNFVGEEGTSLVSPGGFTDLNGHVYWKKQITKRQWKQCKKKYNMYNIIYIYIQAILDNTTWLRQYPSTDEEDFYVFVSSFSRVVKRSHLHILAPRLICSIRHCFWNVPPLMEKNAAHHNGMWSWAQGEMACFIWVLVGSVGFSISHWSYLRVAPTNPGRHHELDKLDTSCFGL